MSKSNIELLLSEWGAWKRGENRNMLGYPSQSPYMRFRVDGQRSASDPDVLLIDDDLRQVDRCIEKLYPGVKTVVVAHYVWFGTSKSKLKHMRLTRIAYYTYHESVHNHLHHCMGG